MSDTAVVAVVAVDDDDDVDALLLVLWRLVVWCGSVGIDCNDKMLVIVFDNSCRYNLSLHESVMMTFNRLTSEHRSDFLVVLLLLLLLLSSAMETRSSWLLRLLWLMTLVAIEVVALMSAGSDGVIVAKNFIASCK